MNTHLNPASNHAVWAPSSAHRWINCSASAPAISRLNVTDSNEAAMEGTAAHDEIEACLGPWSGKVVEPSEIDVSPEDDHPAAYGISLVLAYVRKLPRGTLWIEQLVRLTDEIWGRCDVAHWDDENKLLTIIDYKNGFVDVQAQNNPQLMIYAAASIYQHNLKGVKWIRLVVVQPNSFQPVPRIKQHLISAEELFAFASKVAAIPRATLSFAGHVGAHCRYCPLFGQCPTSQDALKHLGFALVNPPDAVPTYHAATFLALKKPIEDWFKAVESAAIKKALTDGVVPNGMKLVQTTKHQVWVDEKMARELIVERLGVDALDIPTPAQANKKGLDISTLAHRPEGGVALAFESDPRPLFKKPSVAAIFGKGTDQ